MEVQVSLIFFVIGFTTNFIFCCHGIAPFRSNHDVRKVYIVYMGDRLGDNVGLSDAASHHTSILEQVVESGASDYLLHSYHRSFNGFAANLNNNEMRQLTEMEGVVSVFPNGKKQLHTTRSWDFLGFHRNVKRTTLESDIIIGVIDSGISPESQSFSDEGFGPPPTKWKGSCFNSPDFKCNNKIIGAKHYRSSKTFVPGDIQSPLDSLGHGTHTSSIAAGGLVSKASLEGIGLGTARGGVPRARIAVYKVCWLDGCTDADVLAAFDDAIADGVDILSVSLGGDTAIDYFNDVIAIGSFHAMKRGIFSSVAASNDDLTSETISNVAPWFLSVAASTTDRDIVTRIKLGNAKTYEGYSINTIALDSKMYPLIFGQDIPITKKKFNASVSRTCLPFGSPDISKVKGSIVLCDSLNGGQELVQVGAVGGILYGSGYLNESFDFPIPISYLNPTAGSSVSKYYNTTRNPTATIFKSIEKKNKLAPSISSVYPRGPNIITHDILTPDVTAPGVNILAAWSKRTTVTGMEGDKRIVPYNIDTGTSVACPHASGAAAYIKTFQPLWSPAAIKSALITTATPMDGKSLQAEFVYGAGQINPLKAVDPGLIYDLGEVDYVKFLCGQGYSSKNLRLVTGDTSSCNEATNIYVWDLNYPSFTVSTGSKQSVTRIFHRRVTNVGSALSTYKSIVQAPKGMDIQVKPSVLSFKSHQEVKSFVVTVKANMCNRIISGSLVWDDGVHQVRSPIVAYVLPFKYF